LLRLEDILPRVSFLDFEERGEAYVDDVIRLGKTTVILIIDSIRRQCEAISEAILNRSHKMAILALGGWAER
jgi:hypothetical protein